MKYNVEYRGDLAMLKKICETYELAVIKETPTMIVIDDNDPPFLEGVSVENRELSLFGLLDSELNDVGLGISAGFIGKVEVTNDE